jgi:hypothetical protein
MCFLRAAAPSFGFTASFHRRMQLESFDEFVTFFDKIKTNSYDIQYDEADARQQTAVLLRRHLKQLDKAGLQAELRQLDFAAKQTLRCESVKQYIYNLRLDKAVIHLQDLYRQQAALNVSVQLTDAQIAQERENQTRLLEQIKGVGANKFLIKTSRVFDSFMTDLRQCEVKVQILGQRLAAMRAELQSVDAEIEQGDDSLKMLIV